MKSSLLLLTALAMLASSARSATIVLSGRIEGRLPGSVFDEVNYHTLDFYWFRVPEATTVTFSTARPTDPAARGVRSWTCTFIPTRMPTQI